MIYTIPRIITWNKISMTFYITACVVCSHKMHSGPLWIAKKISELMKLSSISLKRKDILRLWDVIGLTQLKLNTFRSLQCKAWSFIKVTFISDCISSHTLSYLLEFNTCRPRKLCQLLAKAKVNATDSIAKGFWLRKWKYARCKCFK